jgi:hypothetical protein
VRDGRQAPGGLLHNGRVGVDLPRRLRDDRRVGVQLRFPVPLAVALLVLTLKTKTLASVLLKTLIKTQALKTLTLALKTLTLAPKTLTLALQQHVPVVPGRRPMPLPGQDRRVRMALAAHGQRNDGRMGVRLRRVVVQRRGVRQGVERERRRHGKPQLGARLNSGLAFT